MPEYVANVSVDDDPSQGPSNAPVTIVEFSDFQCPFCAQAEAPLRQLMADYAGKVRLVYRDLPLETIHAQAFQASLAANCANEQGKFWEMHALLFANQSALDKSNLERYALQLGLDSPRFSTCLATAKYADEIRHDMTAAREYGVNSTPTFFVNGTRVVGIEPLRATIDKTLAQVNP